MRYNLDLYYSKVLPVILKLGIHSMWLNYRCITRQGKSTPELWGWSQIIEPLKHTSELVLTD